MQELAGTSDKFVKNILVVGVGFLLGAALFIFPVVGLPLLLTCIAAIFLFFLGREDAKFIIKIFLISLLLRWILSIIIFTFTHKSGGWFFGDEWGISTRAWQICQYLKGVRGDIWIEYPPGKNDIAQAAMLPLHSYGTSGYTYWVAFWYFFCGYIPILLKILNGILGALTGVIGYFIAKEVFNLRVARVSLVLINFFPSMLLWSALNLKDTMFIFVTMMILMFFIKFQKNRKFIYFILIFVCILVVSTLRNTMWVMVPVSLLFSGFFLLWRSLKAIVKRLIIAVLLVFIFLGMPFLNRASRVLIPRAVSYHIGHVNTEGASYKILPEKYYAPGVSYHNITFRDYSKALLKAIYYFITVPLPRHMGSRFLLISFPQVILWYFLFSFALIGMILSLRYKIKTNVVLIVYLFIMLSVVAMFSGNVGTAFRHRDMFTPFFMIFSAAGILNILGYRILPDSEHK